MFSSVKKRFKRLRRVEDRESDEEQEQQPGEERDAIANELFDGGSNDVSIFCNYFFRVG